MIKKSVTCEDFNGNPYEQDCYFHLSESELVEFETSMNGGVTTMFEKILKETDVEKIMREFKKFFLMSYGEKSLDGRHFLKNDRVLEDFVSSPAYDKIFMELCQDPEAQIAFIRGVMPKRVTDSKEFQEQVEQLKDQQTALPVVETPAAASN